MLVIWLHNSQVFRDINNWTYLAFYTFYRIVTQNACETATYIHCLVFDILIVNLRFHSSFVRCPVILVFMWIVFNIYILIDEHLYIIPLCCVFWICIKHFDISISTSKFSYSLLTDIFLSTCLSRIVGLLSHRRIEPLIAPSKFPAECGSRSTRQSYDAALSSASRNDR